MAAQIRVPTRSSKNRVKCTVKKLALTLALLGTSSCGGGNGNESGSSEDLRTLLHVPDHMELPEIPIFNPPTKEKIALGRALFYDTKLSANQTQSCGSCHIQSVAFTDALRTSIGSTGVRHRRNAQGLSNVAYNSTLTWSNREFTQLEQQIPVPLLSDNPIELGLTDSVREQVLRRFEDDPKYQKMFADAFDGSSEVSLNKIVFAIASFCRTLNGANSPYDRYVRGDKSALTEQQLRGMKLFNSERLECFHCHTGVNLTVSYKDNTSDPNDIPRPFFNNGLYNRNGDGSYPENDQGLYELTLSPRDKGAFRPPSLRNVGLTAPYMHDGSIQTLSDVLDHYARGGRFIPSGENAGDGRLSPLKSGLIRGFEITDQEKEDVIAFLHSLTDEQFITEADFSPPED